MYKLLIVDDEEIELNAFQVMIGHHFEDITVLSAENGIDAIELARKEKPELVFMDIEMPGINGLAAISEIKRENPKTRFVIHTAYGNFDYAQKAIKVGADDYLLKPVKMSALIETIERNIEAIKEEENALHAFQQLEEKLAQLKPYIEKDIIFSVINGVEGHEILRQYASVFEIKKKKAYCVILKVDSLRHEQATLDVNLEQKNKISEEIVALLKQVCQCIASEYISGSVLAIIPLENYIREYDVRVWSTNLASYIRNKLKQKADIKVGIGGLSPNFENIHTSYMEAYRAMCIDTKDMPVIHFEDVKGNDASDMDSLTEAENQLGRAIVMRNKAEAQRLSKKIFELIVIGANNNVAIIKSKILETFAIVKRYIENNTINSIAVSAYNDIELLATITDKNILEKRFAAFVTTIMEEMNTMSSKRNSLIVSDVKKYIEDNYDKEISLEDAAAKVCVTPYYLSRLFKKEMGNNFNNYLTDIRLNKAKQLLRNTSKSIKEIAYDAGFNSQAYFCRVFKKKEDKTPSEYIQSMTADKN